MLRSSPSKIHLSMIDIDQAFRRMEVRRISEQALNLANVPPALRAGPTQHQTGAASRCVDVRLDDPHKQMLYRAGQFVHETAHGVNQWDDVDHDTSVRRPVDDEGMLQGSGSYRPQTTAFVDPVTHLIRTIDLSVALDGVDDTSASIADQHSDPQMFSGKPNYRDCIGQRLFSTKAVQQVDTALSEDFNNLALHQRTQTCGQQNSRLPALRVRSSTISHSPSRQSETSSCDEKTQELDQIRLSTARNQSGFATFPRGIKTRHAGGLFSNHTVVDSEVGLTKSLSTMFHPDARCRTGSAVPSRPSLARLASTSAASLGARAVSSDILSFHDATNSIGHAVEVSDSLLLSHRGNVDHDPRSDIAALIKQGTLTLSPLEKLGNDACSAFWDAPSVHSISAEYSCFNNIAGLPTFGSPVLQDSPEAAAYIPQTTHEGGRTAEAGGHFASNSGELLRLSQSGALALPPADVDPTVGACEPRGSSPNDPPAGHSSSGVHEPMPLKNSSDSISISVHGPAACPQMRAAPRHHGVINMSSPDPLSLPQASRPHRVRRIQRKHAEVNILDPCLVPMLRSSQNPPRSPYFANNTSPAHPPFLSSMEDASIDGLSRYPPNTSDLLHRSLPYPVQDTLYDPSSIDGPNTSRPHSHGDRPHGRMDHGSSGNASGPGGQSVRARPGPGSITGMSGSERVRSFVSHSHRHGHIDARMPPPPSSPSARQTTATISAQHLSVASPRVNRRPSSDDTGAGGDGSIGGGTAMMGSVRRRNQENDGSGEQAMVREELEAAMRLRGGGGGGGVMGVGLVNADVGEMGLGSCRVAAGVVIDDTPPREGRFARLMREEGW